MECWKEIQQSLNLSYEDREAAWEDEDMDHFSRKIKVDK